MLDFKNASFMKLKSASDQTFLPALVPMLVEGEEIVGTYQSIRDGVVFTSKRIIVINIQGFSGKKVDYTSLPYKNIQAYSVETAGVLDLDTELDLWFSGLGKIRLEFVAQENIAYICKIISENVL